MKKIINFISELKKEKEKYGECLQDPASLVEINEMQNNIISAYNVELDKTYLSILKITNGFDNDGTVLYATKTSLIKAYNDRYIDGIITANKEWREDNEKNKFLIYAESEMYLFCKRINSANFFIVSRDDIEYVIFQTSDSEEFFSKIFEVSLGIDIE